MADSGQVVEEGGEAVLPTDDEGQVEPPPATEGQPVTTTTEVGDVGDA